MRHILLLMAVLAPAGCYRSGRLVEFVVPKGHVGPVWILHEPDAPDLPVVDGRYQVRFPDGGVLRVRSMSPFDRFKVVSTRYDDGSPLPYLVSGMQVAPTTVGMWSGWSGQAGPDRREYIVWPVGTEEQKRAFGEVADSAPPNGR